MPAVPLATIPVPGLGFDVPHFFAVHGASSLGHARALFNTGFLRIVDSEFIVPMEPVIVQAQPIIVQQPVILQPVPQATEPQDGPESSPGAAAMEEQVSKPARGSMEYVFVRRDGGVFFAVAFMRENDQLKYITPEGSHRGVALSALDLEATLRFNEERGLTFRLPA